MQKARYQDRFPSRPLYDKQSDAFIDAVPAEHLRATQGILWDQGPLTAFAVSDGRSMIHPLVLDENQAWQLATACCQRTGRSAAVYTIEYDPKDDSSTFVRTDVVDRAGAAVVSHSR